MILTKKFGVYVDFIEKDNEFIPGYIGKGNQTRIYKKERNKQHQNYAKKYNWKRVVGFETDDENEAFEVEMLLIRELHTYVYDPEKSEYACNQTLGGDGPTGAIRSKETCELIGRLSKGRKNPFRKRRGNKDNIVFRQKIADALRRPDTRQKISIALKGKKKSLETREKMSIGQKKYFEQHPEKRNRNKKPVDQLQKHVD